MTARSLILLRHAKAETPGNHPDFERRLTRKGEADAKAAGTWLADKGFGPDVVICSPATRARQTWHSVAMALADVDPNGPAPEVHYEQGLYDGGRTEVFDLLRAVPDGTATVLVVGHNPTMSDVSLLLRPDADPDDAGLKTAGMAVHQAEGSWAQTEPRSMPLVKEHTGRG